jgi:signal transduction histidine kinase
MRVLIEDFLNSAVIESGNLALDLQPVAISDIIERVVHAQQHLASSRNMTLKIDVPSDCPTLQADPSKLEQVLNNLVSNAIEYSSANSEIQIRCSFSNREMTVSVKDFGQGIAPEDLSKLFRPFSTTGAKKGSGQKSTGLGLFLSQKIVEAHRGRIRVESTPHVGSTFYFSLPYFG